MIISLTEHAILCARFGYIYYFTVIVIVQKCIIAGLKKSARPKSDDEKRSRGSGCASPISPAVVRFATRGPVVAGPFSSRAYTVYCVF